jgi:3-phenylpropionate/cinnamic acid dioxygenase small subunit
MSEDLLRTIEQLLYREARLLDQRQFRDRLELFTEDVHYWMPTRFNRLRDREGAAERWEIEREIAPL